MQFFFFDMSVRLNACRVTISSLSRYKILEFDHRLIVTVIDGSAMSQRLALAFFGVNTPCYKNGKAVRTRKSLSVSLSLAPPLSPSMSLKPLQVPECVPNGIAAAPAAAAAAASY